MLKKEEGSRVEENFNFQMSAFLDFFFFLSKPCLLSTHIPQWLLAPAQFLTLSL